MRVTKTSRGFRAVEHHIYPSGDKAHLLQESSVIAPQYEDALDNPGSSYMWVGLGGSFHLDREEVAQLIKYLQKWLKTGHLSRDRKPKDA